MKQSSIMHDLKPERADLTPPLPRVMMVVPCLFYLSAIATVGLGSLFTIKTRQAQAEEQKEMEGEQDKRSQIAGLKTEQAVIDQTHAKAKEVVAWMDSTQPMMDVVTAVVGSIKTGNTLSSLRLNRTAENPQHMEMRVEINNGGNPQQTEIVQALIKAGFQTFKDDLLSSDKNDRFGPMTYTATVVKNSTSEQ